MISAYLVSALANHLWQSTATAACVGLLTLALRRNPARVRYWLWTVASFKFLVPLSLLIVLGAYLRPTAPQPATGPAVSVVLSQVTEPFSRPSSTKRLTHTLDETGLTPLEAPAPYGNTLQLAVAAIWLAGVLVVLFSWWRKWRRICRAVREANRIASIENIPVLSSPSLLEPGVFGIVNPKLVVPEGIQERLTPAQFSAVIAHELCHVRRRDNLVAALHMLMEAVFWFHPLVWWIGTRLVDERERACDEAVVQAGNPADTYAEGILNVCKLYLESPLPCVSGVTGADLKKRIVRIVTRQAARPLDLGRKLLLSAVGLLAVAAPVTLGLLHVVQVRAQDSAASDLSGTWQGTLHAGKDLRTVLKVTKGNGNTWKAEMYSIDQGPGAMPVSSVTLQGSTVKYSIMMIDGSYEGKLSPDGNTIAGTWTQGGGHPLPLEFKRATPGTEWNIPEAPARMKPMAADAKPVFDVATVKPSKPDAQGKNYLMQGHQFSTINTTLTDLLKFAYGIQSRQVVGGPSWISTDKFDLKAEPDLEGAPNDKQLKSMLQKLLADRFKLTFHHEQRELPVYALVVIKGGAKLTKNDENPDGLPGMGFRGLGQLSCVNASMADFAGLMQGAVLDRPVVDRTGLQGRYNFPLKWTPDESQFEGLGIKVPPPSNAADAPPNLFAAVQEQLGLKLDSTKSSVDVLVIDHVEKPSEN